MHELQRYRNKNPLESLYHTLMLVNLQREEAGNAFFPTFFFRKPVIIVSHLYLIVDFLSGIGGGNSIKRSFQP